eukprot:SAG22_NODE_1035_length_5909_cov_4.914802_3_plen_190_part_00
MHYQLYLATKDTYYLHKFMTNITASLEAFISPHGNGMCYYMYTPDPTISNPQHQKVAGCTQLDIPAGQQIRENTTGEPFEVIKLLNDTVLANAHIYWHAGEWCAIGAELVPLDDEAAEGARQLSVVPGDGIVKVWINFHSAPADCADSVVLELSAASDAGASVEFMKRDAVATDARAGMECEDDGWALV